MIDIFNDIHDCWLTMKTSHTQILGLLNVGMARISAAQIVELNDTVPITKELRNAKSYTNQAS